MRVMRACNASTFRNYPEMLGSELTVAVQDAVALQSLHLSAACRVQAGRKEEEWG